MSEELHRPTRQTFQPIERLHDGFFKVDLYRGQYERYDETMSPVQTLEVFERGDSVAVMLFDPIHREVILVEQFRLPTVGKGALHGWILEPAAGIIGPNETVKECALHEIKEETGYQASSLVPISTFFVSPGGSTERIHLFYSEVRRAQRVGEGGGVVEDNENTRVVQMPLGEFLVKLRNREFEDAKLIIGGYWLRDRLAARSPLVIEKEHSRAEFELDLPKVKGWFGRLHEPKKFLGYTTGDIRHVTDVDVWVNPLTSEMVLDRFADHTISALIRRLSAKKFEANEDLVEREGVNEELRRKMGSRAQIGAGKVIVTSPGEMSRTHGVKKIVHVAITGASLQEQTKTTLPIISESVHNILTEVDRERGLKSVLIPMIGTGPNGLTVDVVAPLLIERCAAYFEANPWSRIEHVYFQAYGVIEFDELEQAFIARAKLFKPDARLKNDQPQMEP